MSMSLNIYEQIKNQVFIYRCKNRFFKKALQTKIHKNQHFLGLAQDYIKYILFYMKI